MSYKSEFASNNADLQTILDVVNGLPDKVKKCKVYLNVTESNSSYMFATATIDGMQYVANSDKTPEGTVVEVNQGDKITLYVNDTTPPASYAYIDIAGERVASGRAQTYIHTVNEDTIVNLAAHGTGSTVYGYIEVHLLDTETDTETESTFTPTDSGGTTYKSKFADNNVDLRKMLEAINALSAEPETVKITLIGVDWLTWDGDITYIVHNGTTYTSPTTFEAKVGDKIEITAGNSSNHGGSIFVNNQTVASTTSYTEGAATYTYTVVSDAIFEVGGDASEGYVSISEASAINFVEYIQSSGTQYIDTGIYPTQNTRVVMDVQLTSATSTSNQWLFGGRTASENASFGFYHYKNYFGGCYGNEQNDGLSGLSALTRLSIDFYEDQLILNGETICLFNAEQTFTSTGTLCLLARNTAGTVAAQASAKLYSCKIYQNDVLVRDYIPCKNSNATACLYDKVNNTYIFNAGTSIFTAGPSVGGG